MARLGGSTPACQRTLLQVKGFTSQVVAGTLYEFDVVVGHSTASTLAACGAPADLLEETCHLVVFYHVYKSFWRRRKGMMIRYGIYDALQSKNQVTFLTR